MQWMPLLVVYSQKEEAEPINLLSNTGYRGTCFLASPDSLEATSYDFLSRVTQRTSRRQVDSAGSGAATSAPFGSLQ